MRPMIIALGRSDNHALLAVHARSLGVEYLGVEGFEVSELLREGPALKSWISKSLGERANDRALLLAVIDGSVTAATLRSFASRLESAGLAQISVRTTPEMLESIALSTERDTVEDDRDCLYLLSIARSPHSQVAIWPVVTLNSDGTVRQIADQTNRDLHDDPRIEGAIERALSEASENSIVGVVNYVIDPEDGSLLRREFGVTAFTFWSESASYTTVSEEVVRAILDLPLGDTRMIDYEEFFLQEELEIDSKLVVDPIRPFLHLFARNPRLKVRYLNQVIDEMSEASPSVRISISLFASTQEEALTEMAHARDFMMGK